MDADPRLTAVWHVEECSDEYRENCPCIIATGEGDRIQYVADAETPELAARITADHNEVVALREQLAERDRQINGLLAAADEQEDELTGLQLKLDRYVGKEPTLRDEMAYLHRCLNAVFDLCREADRDGNTSDGRFTPTAVLKVASGEREDAPADNRRRIYLDGHGQAWIETTEGYVSAIEMASHEGEPLAQVRERTGEIHEIGRTW